jgi:DNA-binding NtrC family response regulator
VVVRLLPWRVVIPRPRSDGSGDATRALRQPAPAAPLGAVIRVIGVPAAPARYQLTQGRCVLGAGSRADVLIQHDTVSRAHLELELVPEGVMVTDLGSRNGTFYLGQRVEKMVLGLGSRIQLGTVEVVIDADTESLPAGDERGAGTPLGHRGLVGTSAAMRRLCAVLMRLEGSLVNVLIEGESGSGKELIARAIHQGSNVGDGPLVVVNCGAIPRELIASELFGHRRGAFTGAHDDRVGAFENAHGGTLFLDEVGELPLEAQPALLRALEAGEVQRLGDSSLRKVKVRIVAATNRELEDDVRLGRFREDLFYRLAVVRLGVAPLRERREDIPLLARHFASESGLPVLPEEVVARFRAHSWPGNVRELRNAVHAYLAVGILPGDPRPGEGELEAAVRNVLDVRRPYAELKEAFLHGFTKTYLDMLLTMTGANQSEAARVSGLDRGYLGRMLVRYGVRRPDRATDAPPDSRGASESGEPEP